MRGVPGGGLRGGGDEGGGEGCNLNMNMLWAAKPTFSMEANSQCTVHSTESTRKDDQKKLTTNYFSIVNTEFIVEIGI